MVHKEQIVKNYFFPTEVKDCNVMINDQMFFNQAVKNIMKTYENIRKIARAQGDD